MRFNTNVTRVHHDDSTDKWILEIKGCPDEVFDKVIMATGTNQTPNYPSIAGIESFRGEQVHSKSYKRPEKFENKSVLVVGLGNSGADIAVSLIKHATKIYASHRKGCVIIPRKKNGKPVDHPLTIRFMSFHALFDRFFPKLSEAMLNFFIRKLQDSAFNIRPEWKLSPAPSIRTNFFVVSDEIVPALERGDIESVPGIRRIVGPYEVELTDGRVPHVDTIIYCTGYQPSFSLLDPKDDPNKDTTPEWAKTDGSRGKPLPRLYQNLLSLKYPQSLAFMGCVVFPSPAFQLYDVASMVVTQIWKGNSPLPPQEEMERAVDKHHAWMVELAKKDTVFAQLVNGHEWTAWANEMAGTGINEYLGWGWKGWKFWLQEPRFCNLLMTGVYSPHVFRYFEGKRKRWDGAKAAIERLNESQTGKLKTV
nr:uncharacterized protein CTRU02_14739 [Colletotrichum truncatum]KAF6781862.1 hypothetical protein CTRU02_14739 [Colletotrichum truncatum]